MSRRYGRNQRRRAREELAREKILSAALADTSLMQQRQIAQLRNAVSSESARANLYKVQLQACAEALGESFALPPVSREASRDMLRMIDREGIRTPILKRLTPMAQFQPGQEPAAIAEMRAVTLDALEAHLETHGYGRLAEQPHMLLTCNGRTVYACPVPAFAQLNREEGIRRIANLIASEAIDTVRRLGHFR